MEEPKSLDSLFKDKIFRIPDYQRGYAWQPEQLKDFWEDLINLSDNRTHYTGVLTLKPVPTSQILSESNEHWLVEYHSHGVYEVVDGQQRLTTFVVFLQALADLVRELPQNEHLLPDQIYIADSLTLQAVEDRFLFKTKPGGTSFRTYLFGYETDNPSYQYLRHQIFGEEGGGQLDETIYTLNLSNAKTYLMKQLRYLYGDRGIEALADIYKKLTKHLLFNEYVIREELDVFVAFETMNNRGKKLSDLELLKNRLIYLTTLFCDEVLDTASRKDLRDSINDAWKQVYHQLGRNKEHPLNDNDFLRAHWIMYFRYSRKTGLDYIRFLLEDQFTPRRIHKQVEHEIALEVPQEQRSEEATELDEDAGALVEIAAKPKTRLEPIDLKQFSSSLKQSALHWFDSFYPHLSGLSDHERQWIDRLNRIGITYFRPLVMSIHKNVSDETERIVILRQIERFIFIAFRLNGAMANYASSEFYNAARGLDRKERGMGPSDILAKLNERLSYTFNEDGSFREADFFNSLHRRFKSGSGYYGWPAMRYFLYEYETDLLSGTRQRKVDWDLLKSEKDKISIEHIYPQTETADWATLFNGVSQQVRANFAGSLGNLLLLSRSINASLQNDSFDLKKHPKYAPSGQRLRNGYSDGSHSEIEVAQLDAWGPAQIREQGLKLLAFMERRWDFRFRDPSALEKLLFLEKLE